METIFLIQISLAGFIAALCGSGLFGFALCAGLISIFRASHVNYMDIEEEQMALARKEFSELEDHDFSYPRLTSEFPDDGHHDIDDDIKQSERIRNNYFNEFDHE